MARIHVLPMSVVNRIAAGEVVERPASVLKELLENALDSGAGRVDVEIEHGGVGLVRVVDDGGGIEPEDLPLAVTAHATSKLETAEDLERIGTLGFRGEALASIAEVARVAIRSRTPGGTGAVLEVDGGRMGEVLPAGCAVGTTVEVHQLFGNVPARRAFLRAPQTEWSHCAEAFVRTALAHPGVALTLAHNGRRVHDLPAVTSWRERIGGIFGGALAARLVDVAAADGEIRVEGLVGRPEDDVAGTRLQHLFVAGRPFRDRSLLHAVQEGYRGMMLSGRQPIAFLAFSLPPEMVDVNVHPSKLEVRFREPSRIYRLVLSALRTTFLEGHTATRLAPPEPAPWEPPRRPPADALEPVPRTVVAGAAGRLPLPAWERDERPASAALPAVVSPAPRPPEGHRPDRAGTAVQMHDRYIVVETADGIEVIDQHALHERLLYERLKASLAAGSLEIQPLLIPERVDLPAAEIELVEEHAASLARAGLRVEPFGGSTVIVSSKPVLAGATPAADIVREILGRLSAGAARGDTAVAVDEVLHGLACRAAVKAGDPLSPAEVEALVRDRERVPESHHCPHGRPTSLVLSRQDLDRQFRRT